MRAGTGSNHQITCPGSVLSVAILRLIRVYCVDDFDATTFIDAGAPPFSRWGPTRLGGAKRYVGVPYVYHGHGLRCTSVPRGDLGGPALEHVGWRLRL
jgi:hypothetical protein